MTKEAFNPQRVVDAVVAGLASQGFKRSLMEGSIAAGCAYNGKDGRHCAAGWLLKPGAQPKEGMTVNHIEVAELLQDWARPDNEDPDAALYDSEEWKQWSLLSALQTAHDEGLNPEVMKEKLRRVIGQFGLVPPQVLR